MSIQSNAINSSIDERYLLQLFNKYTNNKHVESSFEQNDTWPIKIYTLGRFRLINNGEPLTFPGRAKRRPLEMLKALIAFGGRDVSQERLSEALWPDSEGDAAHRSFDTTLHRLRKLIGNDKAIVLQEGRLSLNSDVCWVDAWAFERLQGKVESILDNTTFFNAKDDKTDEKTHLSNNPYSINLEEVGLLCDQTLSLYQDHFLSHSTEESWCLTYRERLRSKFIRLLRKAGRHWENNSQWYKAVDCYQRGLELDNLIEGFYQGLMNCYRQLDLNAEAIVNYNRCKENLYKYLNIKPSKTTEEIYDSLLN
ncbi:MAG: hypothetical protein GXP19_00390 [Gammaproteobacteria bacterium]|nr:hypothetical protein [Gammaproteobacteria bacterium]